MRPFVARGHNELCPYTGCSLRYVVIILCLFHNVLIISMLLTALQKAVFWLLKGGLLQPERPSLASSKAIFYKTGG